MKHPDPSLVALTIQQPWAELILRGLKTIELRTLSCKLKTIYLYTSQKPSTLVDAKVAIDTHGLTLEDLDYGKVVGMVDVVGCRPATSHDAQAACIFNLQLTGYNSWLLANPRRCAPEPPNHLPYGCWFYPFRRLDDALSS